MKKNNILQGWRQQLQLKDKAWSLMMRSILTTLDLQSIAEIEAI